MNNFIGTVCGILFIFVLVNTFYNVSKEHEVHEASKVKSVPAYDSVNIITAHGDTILLLIIK